MKKFIKSIFCLGLLAGGAVVVKRLLVLRGERL